MPTLVELANEHTNLDDEAIDHLSTLVSEWGMLADFSFADMLLYLRDGSGKWMTSAQVRAATGQTLYQADYVNAWASESETIVLDRCLAEGEIVSEGSSREVVVQSPVFAPQVAKILAPLRYLTLADVRAGLAAAGQAS